MTKQLNKKGTSLVELIAVIVIMGIIAGIAIPTTIAVINRQKKNAAVKSAETVVSTIRNLLSEAQVEATKTGSVYIKVVYSTAADTAPTITVYDGESESGANITSATGYGAEDVIIDNFTGTGTATGLLKDGKSTFGGTLTISGYDVTLSNMSAAKHSGN